MSITPYCSSLEFAIKQGFDSLADFLAEHTDYPPESTIDDMLEDATQLINIEIGIEDITSNITDTGWTTYLRNLCYRMLILMIDEELGRSQEERRSQHIPRDYMFERDRSKLQRLGMTKGYRLVGKIG